MIRPRFTWVIVGAVAVLLVVAGVDALRSSLSEESASTTTASTTTGRSSSTQTVAPCTRQQVAVSIEVRHAAQTGFGLPVLPRRRRVATIVERRVGAQHCWQQPLPVRFRIFDRTGDLTAVWLASMLLWPNSPGAEVALSLPDVLDCDRPGPFRALAEVGPYTVRRGHLGYSDITCWKGRASA
jgi:hypothetical protein